MHYRLQVRFYAIKLQAVVYLVASVLYLLHVETGTSPSKIFCFQNTFGGLEGSRTLVHKAFFHLSCTTIPYLNDSDSLPSFGLMSFKIANA